MVRPKKLIKESEARILVYLNIVHNTRKNVTAISNKLAIDYSYTMKILQSMVYRGWLKKHQYRRHMFYDLTALAPVEAAMADLSTSSLQQNLLSTFVDPDPEVKSGPDNQ